MADPRFFRCAGDTYDERARNPFAASLTRAFDEITGGSGSVALSRLRTDFDITGRRFETSLRGRVLDSGEDGGEFSFRLDVVARGRAILAKKDPRTAKEFDVRKAEGFLRIKDETGDRIGSVAFNLRTLFPIKLCREVFRGDFEAVAAKIDPDRSRVTGRGAFSSLSSFASGAPAVPEEGLLTELLPAVA